MRITKSKAYELLRAGFQVYIVYGASESNIAAQTTWYYDKYPSTISINRAGEFCWLEKRKTDSDGNVISEKRLYAKHNDCITKKKD